MTVFTTWWRQLKKTYEVQVFAGLAEEEALHAVLVIKLRHVVNGRVATSADEQRNNQGQGRHVGRITLGGGKQMHQIFDVRCKRSFAYVKRFSNGTMASDQNTAHVVCCYWPIFGQYCFQTCRFIYLFIYLFYFVFLFVCLFVGAKAFEPDITDQCPLHHRPLVAPPQR